MLVVQIEYVRFLDVTVGGDEQVGQRPLGCAETFDFGRLVETFLLLRREPHLETAGFVRGFYHMLIVRHLYVRVNEDLLSDADGRDGGCRMGRSCPTPRAPRMRSLPRLRAYVGKDSGADQFHR